MTDQPASASSSSPSSCPECGDTCVPAQAIPGTLGVQRPDAIFGIFAGFSPLRAVVCTHCGLTRLYALHPDKVVPRE